MKLFDAIKRLFFGRKLRTRLFSGAKTTRLTLDWDNVGDGAIDRELRYELKTLRQRSRELYYNNDYVKKYVQLIVQNVVGPEGFILQNDARDINGNPDVAANEIIENAWYEWGLKYADVTRRQSFRGLCETLCRQLVIDGEVFVRTVVNKSNKYGIELQVIEADYLDENYNEVLKNGNIVRMGVEINKWRQPVAYWFKVVDIDKEMNIGYNYTGEYKRISADEIIHIFLPDRANQTRGVPWTASSMNRLKWLGDYENAAVINAKISASKMGFFKSTHPELIGKSENLEIEISPGHFEQLPPGCDFVPFTPEFPSSQHGDFVKSTLRGIASGLGVSYNTLANDLEGVNYSSIRAGLLDEREFYKSIQAMFIEKLLIPLFEKWLMMALTMGVLKMSDDADPLPMRKFDKFNKPIFYGRRWAWVDPLKDIEAEILAIEKNLKTYSEVMADRGRDFADTLKQLQKEKQLLKDYGLLQEENNRSNGKSRNYKQLIKELENENR